MGLSFVMITGKKIINSPAQRPRLLMLVGSSKVWGVKKTYFAWEMQLRSIN